MPGRAAVLSLGSQVCRQVIEGQLERLPRLLAQQSAAIQGQAGDDCGPPCAGTGSTGYQCHAYQ